MAETIVQEFKRLKSLQDIESTTYGEGIFARSLRGVSPDDLIVEYNGFLLCIGREKDKTAFIGTEKDMRNNIKCISKFCITSEDIKLDNLGLGLVSSKDKWTFNYEEIMQWDPRYSQFIEKINKFEELRGVEYKNQND